MFKTIVTLLVSLMITAGAAVGLDADQSALMADLQARVDQTAGAEADFTQNGFGLTARSESSARTDAGAESGRSGASTETRSGGEGEAEGSAESEIQVNLSGLEELWQRLRARLEQTLDNLQARVEQLALKAELRGKAHGSVEAGVGDRGSADLDSAAAGSAGGSFSAGTREEGGGLIILPFLDGSDMTQGESESSLVLNLFGQ